MEMAGGREPEARSLSRWGIAQDHTLATAHQVAHFTSHGMNENCKYTLNLTRRLEYLGSRYCCLQLQNVSTNQKIYERQMCSGTDTASSSRNLGSEDVTVPCI